MFKKIVLSLALVLLLVLDIKGVVSNKERSISEGEVRGHRGGSSSQQYHYTSFGGGQRPNGGGQIAPTSSAAQYDSAADAVAADPTYALYLAVGFMILLVALGYIIYPILSEKVPPEGSKTDERSFSTLWDAHMTETILSAIEKVIETYKEE